jgi:hypothetical protein
MTDRFSLAILLFYIFMLGHPLKGRLETDLPYDPSDPDGSRRLCADSPVFVFDPVNTSNRPVPGMHDPVLNFWPIYPESFRNLFVRSFTAGLNDPDSRVMENEWRKDLSRLRDSIFHCPQCTAENFLDLDRIRRKEDLEPCWSCGRPQTPPPRMRVGAPHDFSVVVLNPGTQLFSHHLEADPYNFAAPLAEVTAHPLGLRNLSRYTWSTRDPSNQIVEVRPGNTLLLCSGAHIRFGVTEGDVKI